MKLAINYSPAAARLVESEKIQIDYFKCPDWDWLITLARDLKPVAVHFTLDAGNHNIGEVDWNAVERIAQSTRTPYINLHLDAKQATYPDLSVETLDPADIKRVYTIIISDVMQVVNRFGAERVIIENNWYRGEAGNTLRMCIQPDVISRIIEDTGCGLLLDLAHAIIAARYIGMEPHDYISHLPLHKLKEMHFAGIHRVNGKLMDHLSILKANWLWLDWALEHIQSGEWSPPWLLAFEYGGIGPEFEWRTKSSVITRQVPQLFSKVKAVNR